MKSLFKQKISRDFNKAASIYDEHAIIQRKAADYLFCQIKDDIKNDSLTLDAGCGTGYFHELLRKNKIYCPLLQTDIAYNMCRKSAEYASPIEYGGVYTFASDIEKLPLSPRSIDIVFSSLTVQWADLDMVLSQLHKSLKNKGKIAIATIGEGTLFELKQASLIGKKSLNINGDFKSEKEIKELFIKHGFKNITTQVQTIKIEHDNLKKLLTSIKGVGAIYKGKRNNQYLGKDYFKWLENNYREQFSLNTKLVASWNIIYVKADN
jgi:malonyl-CoA O-methyltransferase